MNNLSADDKTRLMSTSSSADDNTCLMPGDAAQDSTCLMDTPPAVPQSAPQDMAAPDVYLNTAKGRKSKISNSNMAAAGIGVVAGAAVGAGVSAAAAPSHADTSLDATEVTPETDDTMTDKDVSDDAVANGVSADADAAGVNTAADSTYNVNVNVNVNTNGQPLEVSGPNPADATAVHSTVTEGARAIHNQPSSHHQAEEPAPVEPEPVLNTTNVDPYSDVQVATVSDDMSFSEAFAAARAQVGPGGAFTWHGQVYGTYYQNEWQNMSPAEQHQFQMAAVSHSEYHNTPAADLAAKPVDSAEATYYDEPADDSHVAFVDPEPAPDENDVRVLGMTEIEDADGEMHQAALLDFSGTPAMVVDTDFDMVYDQMVADLNGDGVVTPDELADISEAGLTYNDVEQQYIDQQTADMEYDSFDCSTSDADITGAVDGDFDCAADVSDYA